MSPVNNRSRGTNVSSEWPVTRPTFASQNFFSRQSYFLHRAFGYDGLRLATSWEGLKCLPITIQQKDSCDGTILTRN
jgi:hypothetical protein